MKNLVFYEKWNPFRKKRTFDELKDQVEDYFLWLEDDYNCKIKIFDSDISEFAIKIYPQFDEKQVQVSLNFLNDLFSFIKRSNQFLSQSGLRNTNIYFSFVIEKEEVGHVAIYIDCYSFNRFKIIINYNGRPEITKEYPNRKSGYLNDAELIRYISDNVPLEKCYLENYLVKASPVRITYR